MIIHSTYVQSMKVNIEQINLAGCCVGNREVYVSCTKAFSMRRMLLVSQMLAAGGDFLQSKDALGDGIGLGTGFVEIYGCKTSFS